MVTTWEEASCRSQWWFPCSSDTLLLILRRWRPLLQTLPCLCFVRLCLILHFHFLLNISMNMFISSEYILSYHDSRSIDSLSRAISVKSHLTSDLLLWALLHSQGASGGSAPGLDCVMSCCLSKWAAEHTHTHTHSARSCKCWLQGFSSIRACDVFLTLILVCMWATF